MPEEQTRESLADQIFHSLTPSKFDDREQLFLPDDCIVRLITKDAIRDMLGLGSNSTSSQEQVVEWIYREARRVFATTIQCSISLSDVLKCMTTFQKRGFSDASLPIDNPRRSSDQEWLRHFRPKSVWTPIRLYCFWENQWKFLTPVFAMDRYDYDLLSECIFPFTWKDPTFKEGAFSCVSKVKIHSAHQKHEFDEVRAP